MGLATAQQFVQSVLQGATPPGGTGLKGPLES